MEQYLVVFLLAVMSGLSALIGCVLAFCFQKKLNSIIIGIGFSTGLMLLMSFLEIIPESYFSIGLFNVLVATVFGALFIIVLDFLVPHTEIIREEGKIDGFLLKAAYMVAIGLILHDLPEGFALANSYLFNPDLGVFISVSMALHNIAEYFAMAIPFVLLKNKRTLVKLAFVSAFAEPLGATIGLVAVSFVPKLTPFFLAFAAAAMIYVSIHELMPLARRYKRIKMFFVGVLISAVVYMLLHYVILM